MFVGIHNKFKDHLNNIWQAFEINNGEKTETF